MDTPTELEQHRRVFSQSGVLGLIAALVMTVACGSPEGGDDGFTFDPVPVVTLPNGTPVSVDPATCGIVAADEVVVTMETTEADDFEAWVTDVGFGVKQRREMSVEGMTLLLINVPPGAVPDAVEAIRERPGIVEAGANSYRFTGPAPTPPLACTPQP